MVHPLFLTVGREAREPSSEKDTDGDDYYGSNKSYAEVSIQEKTRDGDLKCVGPELVHHKHPLSYPFDIRAHQGYCRGIVRNTDLCLVAC